MTDTRVEVTIAAYTPSEDLIESAPTVGKSVEDDYVADAYAFSADPIPQGVDGEFAFRSRGFLDPDGSINGRFLAGVATAAQRDDMLVGTGTRNNANRIYAPAFSLLKTNTIERPQIPPGASKIHGQAPAFADDALYTIRKDAAGVISVTMDGVEYIMSAPDVVVDEDLYFVFMPLVAPAECSSLVLSGQGVEWDAVKHNRVTFGAREYMIGGTTARWVEGDDLTVSEQDVSAGTVTVNVPAVEGAKYVKILVNSIEVWRGKPPGQAAVTVPANTGDIVRAEAVRSDDVVVSDNAPTVRVETQAPPTGGGTPPVGTIVSPLTGPMLPWDAGLMDETKQYAGMGLGCFAGGVITGNSVIAGEIAIRQRVQKTGNITGSLHDNRTLTQRDIDTREPYTFCRQQADRRALTPLECAFAGPNPYASGQGEFSMELRRMSETSPDDPDAGPRLGIGTLDSYRPFDEPNSHGKVLNLDSPAAVTAGEHVWFILRNSRMLASGKYDRNSIADIISGALDPSAGGGRSLNGDVLAAFPDSQYCGFGGPFRSNSTLMMRRTTPTGAWSRNGGGNVGRTNLPWLELIYDDGVHTGDWVTSQQSNLIQINNNDILRQKVIGNGLTYDRFVLAIGYHRNGTPNGDPATVTIRDGSLSPIATGVLPSNQECIDLTRLYPSNRYYHMSRTWTICDLSADVTADVGSVYYFDIEPSAGALMSVQSYFSSDYPPFNARSINQLGGAFDTSQQVTISRNGGAFGPPVSGYLGKDMQGGLIRKGLAEGHL